MMCLFNDLLLMTLQFYLIYLTMIFLLVDSSFNTFLVLD